MNVYSMLIKIAHLKFISFYESFEIKSANRIDYVVCWFISFRYILTQRFTLSLRYIINTLDYAYI